MVKECMILDSFGLMTNHSTCDSSHIHLDDHLRYDCNISLPRMKQEVQTVVVAAAVAAAVAALVILL
jgi:hypothetical protein